MRDSLVVLVTTASSLHNSTRELATRLASRANAVLQFLHVLPLDPASDGEGALHSALDTRSGSTERWHAALTPTEGSVRFRHHFLIGDPEAQISEFVRAHDVQFLVVEEPPRSLLSEALWRGLAERLIRGVDCPVVIGGPGFLRAEPQVKQPVYSRVDAATTADLLNAMVEARVEALRHWLDQAATLAGRIGGSETVRTAVAMAGGHRGLMEQRIEQRLYVEMNEHRQASRAMGWRLTSKEQVWASHDFMVQPGPALVEFLGRVQELGQAASRPMPLSDGCSRLVVLAGAHITTPAGASGLLVLAFDAEDDFLRILGQPGPLPSFETYAFDRTGLMLSKTRFPGDLVTRGVLLSDDLQTPLRIRVAEPSAEPRATWPLTRMAQAATSRRDGCDTSGYLDYRGVLVMGAWRWLADHGFGVVAEIDLNS